MKRQILTRVLKASFKEPFCRNFAYNYIRRKNLEHASARGQRMAVYANDLIGLFIYLNGVHEKDEIEDVLQLMALLGIDIAGSSVIDVGANIGNHSIEFSRHFEKVYAFEPDPHTFKLLSFNADFRPNIAVFNHGLSDKDETLLLSEDIENYGGSSAVLQGGRGSPVSIEVKRLDDISDGIRDIRLIKIDVEGMELNVLKGAVVTMQSHQPVIAFEQHESEFIEGGETASIEFLRSLGYEMCVIETDRDRQTWFSRRLRNVSELLFGRKDVRSVVMVSEVARGTYDMIIALPAKYAARVSAAQVVS